MVRSDGVVVTPHALLQDPPKPFTFKKHDRLDLRLKMKQLVIGRSEGKDGLGKSTDFTLELEPMPVLMDTFFCVFLGGKGDAVRIVS